MQRPARVARPSRARRVPVVVAALAIAATQLVAGAVPALAYTFTAGSCSVDTLIAFIEGANDETSYPGGDTINLKAGCTYLVGDEYAERPYGLPPITSDIVVVGHGARIQLAPGATARSLFDVRSGASLILSDLTLAEAIGQNAEAGSVRNFGSTTLSHVTITHSVPYGQSGVAVGNRPGGVLAIISSTIEHQSCLFCDATAIYNESSLTITDSDISGNTRTAAVVNKGTASIYGSTFDDNTSSAIVNVGTVEIHGSSFVGNQDDSRGGAIDNRDSAGLAVDGSYFEDNFVDDEGGAIYSGVGSTASVVNSTFYDNIAANPGFPCCVGGIGGAIANHGSLAVEYATFLRNRAATGSTIGSPEGSATITASVLDGIAGITHCSGTIVDGGSNVVASTGSGCPATFIVGDPQLDLPKVHGSGTKTLALGAGSAAFDAVVTAGCPAYDQRGAGRPVGARCDAGAFEDRRPNVPGVPALSAGTSPTNTSFSLAWTAATDPDGTSVTYRLYRKDADDAHYTLAASSTSPNAGLTTEPEGTIRYAVLSDDGNLLSSRSADSLPIVVDRTAPSAPRRVADRSPDAGAWFRDTVTVTFFGSSDPDLPDGSPGSGVVSYSGPATVTTSGVHTITGTATDAAGNESDETTATVRVDAEDPVVAFEGCPRDVILGSSAGAAWAASDASSGIAGATSGSVPLDTATLGSRSATVTVSDLVGHQATATCAYRVIYAFDGFFAPLANPPSLVTVRAGDTINVGFSLDGNQGLQVIVAGSPQSAPVSCTSPGLPDAGTATTAARPLAYLASVDRYRYLWTTPKSWAGTCRQLILTLADGTTHRANVRFR